MPEVSLIVPVYNVKEFLPGCLRSLTAQTVRDIEIVCIEDGSTDGSAALLDQLAAGDSRICAYHRKNGGLSSARNEGIERAQGRVIMFVDADDELEPRACEAVLGALDRSGADIVTFGATCFPAGEAEPELVECLSPRDVRYERFSMDLLLKEHARPYVWRSAFRAAFLRDAGLRFDEEVRFGEDQVFYFAAYPRAQRVLLMSERLYRYRVARSSSMMAQVKDDRARRVSDHLGIVEHIYADWKQAGFLNQYGRQLLAWTVEFILRDVCALEQQDRDAAAARFGRALRTTFGDGAAALGDGAAGTRILTAFLAAADGHSFQVSTTTMYRYYLHRRGIRACVHRVLAR